MRCSSRCPNGPRSRSASMRRGCGSGWSKCWATMTCGSTSCSRSAFRVARDALRFLIPMLAVAPVLAAQTVELRLRNDSTRTFVAGAIVRLLGPAGIADQGLTDELGRLTLRATSAGNYRLRIDRIGFAALLTESFDLASGETLAKDIEVSSHAQQLPPIEVVGKSQCSGAGMAGTPAGILWEEIQKALTANLITIRRAAVPLP